jgi:hypothetical protein
MLKRLRRSIAGWLKPVPRVESRRKMQFEALEPRVLLSADLGVEQLAVSSPTQTDALAIEQPHIQPGEPTQGSDGGVVITPPADRTDAPNELVFVDSKIHDSQGFIEKLTESYADSSRFEIHLLDSDSSGINQISRVLEDRSGLDAVHIISHGDAAELILGSDSISPDTFGQFKDQLSGWGQSFKEGGDILLYGCNVGSGEAGLSFVESLSALTGLDVAASDNPTGTGLFSGDWVLEASTGTVETASLSVVDYRHLLFGISGTNFADSLILDDHTDDGWMRYSFDAGATWTAFSVGAEDLEIDLGTGDDILEIRGFDTSFAGRIAFIGGAGNDSIIVKESAAIFASQILFEAEEIVIHTGALLDSTISGSGDGSLVLRAEADGSGLLGSVFRDVAHAALGDDGVGEAVAVYIDEVGLPIDYVPARARIEIQGATLIGSSVSVTATATIDEHELDIPFSLKVLVENAQAQVLVIDSALTATAGDLILSAASNVTADNTAKSLGTPLADAAGSVTVVVSEAHTVVSGNSSLEAGGEINVLAGSTTSVKTVADGTVGGMTSAGGVAAVTVVVTDARAGLEGGVNILGTNAFTVKAASSNTITTTAVATPGGADGNGGLISSLLGTNSMSTGSDEGSDGETADPLSLAGAVAISVLRQTTNSFISGNFNTIACSGQVTVASESESSVTTKADAGSTNTPTATVGAGVAAAGNIIVTTTTASLSGEVSFTGAAGVTVSAGMPDGATHSSSVTAVSGASSGSFGAAGAFALNVATSTTRASILEDSMLDLGQADLSLKAISRTGNTVLATGTQEGEGGIGVGGSMALNIAVNESTADIDGNAGLTAIHGLSLTAEGAHLQNTTAEAGAGGDMAVSPATALSVAVNETNALLPFGEAMQLAGGLVLAATHSGSQTTRGKADASGKSAGFGLGLGLGVSVESATARLDRDVQSASGDVRIEAAALVDVTTSSTASSAGEAPSEEGSEEKTADSQIQEKANIATGRGEVKDKTKDLPPPKAETSEGDLGVAGALAVNVVVSSATAEITEGRKLTTDGRLTVTSANDTDASASADAGAVGSGNECLAPVLPSEPIQVSFNDNGDRGDTITRTDGSWIEDGFAKGDAITVNGSNSNDNTYIIADITDNGKVLVLADGYFLTDEGDAADVRVTLKARGTGAEYSGTAAHLTLEHREDQADRITRTSGSWIEDGFAKGDTIAVTASGEVTTYTIAELSALSITLSEAADLGTLNASEITSIRRATSEESSSTPGIGIGVAGAVNSATILNRAVIAGDVTAKGITLEATMDGRDSDDPKHTLAAKAVSGAGAGEVGVAGSLAVNVGVAFSQALVTDTAVLDAGDGSVILKAQNKTASTTEASAKETPSGSSGFGVGASFALNVGVNTTQAVIAGGAGLTDAGGLSLTAEGEHTAATTAQAGAGGATGASGAVALHVGVNTTTAKLPHGSVLDIDGGLTLQADHKGSGTATSTADTAASEGGFAAGLALAVEVDKVEAVLDRNVIAAGDVTIHAHAVSDSSASSTAGSNGAKPDEGGDSGSGEKKEAKEQIDKQVDFATKQKALDGVETPKPEDDSTQTSEGGVSVGAALAVNVAVSESTAVITEGTILNAGGKLTLSAANDTDGSATADASASGKGKAAEAEKIATPATVTGDAGLAFADNGSNAATLTRSSGSWEADGYRAGGKIIVTGAQNVANNGMFTITSISLDGRVLILKDAQFAAEVEESSGPAVKVSGHTLGKLNGDAVLTFFDAPGTNADTISRSTGSWLADGFTTGDAIRVKGSGSNDNTYVIAKATNSVLFLEKGYFLESASSVSGVEVTLLKRAEEAKYSGNAASLTYLHQAEGADQIRRSDAGGSWIKDGFAVGDTIVVSLTDGTTRKLTIGAISDSELTLGNNDDVSSLSAGQTVSIAREAATSTEGGGTSGIGVGIAAAVNSATVLNRAIIAGDVTAKGLAMEAVMDGRDSEDNKHTLAAKAVSGASSGDVGVAGAFAANVGVLASDALVTDTASLTILDAQDVSLSAANKSDTTVVATGKQSSVEKSGGDDSDSNSVGVGGSFALNVGVNTARAEVDGNADLTGSGALSLTATGEHAAAVTSEAGAGGDIGVAGAVALHVGVNTTTAKLPHGSDLTIDGGLTLKAEHKGSAKTTANADAAGDKVGVGVGLALSVEVDQAVASLERSLTSTTGDALIQAHSLSDSSTEAKAGSKGADPDSDKDASDGEDKKSTADEQVGKKKEFLSNRAGNTGTNLPETKDPDLENSDGDKVNIGAAAAVNIAVSESTARIAEGITLVVENGAVTVSAANDTDAAAKADASAVGKGPESPTDAKKAAVLTGGVTLTFADNDSERDTITRSSGSWTADGFAVGDTITVAGTTDNNTSEGSAYTIAAISSDGLTLTLAEADSLTAEKGSGSKLKVAKDSEDAKRPIFTGGPDMIFADNGAGHNDTITLSSGTWTAAGFAAGDTITVVGTGNSDIDKQSFTIKAISLDGRVLTLADGDSLTGLNTFSGSDLRVAKVVPGSLSGFPELTFSDNGSKGDEGFTGDTIVRSEGSWIEDGFAVGATVRITGAKSADGETSNDGSYVVAGISSDGRTLTLAADETFADLTLTETSGVIILQVNRGDGATLAAGQDIDFVHNEAAPDAITRSEGSWIDDGFAVGDAIAVTGSGSNNGTFSIAAISGDGKTITLKQGETLTAESVAGGGSLKITLKSSDKGGDGTGVGIGVAVGVNTAVVTNRAMVLGDIHQTPADTTGNDRAKGLTIEAVMDTRDADGKHVLGATAISGASGGDVGVAGALAVNVSVLSSEAFISEGSTINVGHADNKGNLTLRAENKSSATVVVHGQGHCRNVPGDERREHQRRRRRLAGRQCGSQHRSRRSGRERHHHRRTRRRRQAAGNHAVSTTSRKPAPPAMSASAPQSPPASRST